MRSQVRIGWKHVRMSWVEDTFLRKVQVDDISTGIKSLNVCNSKSSIIRSVFVAKDDSKGFLLCGLKLVTLVDS